ncbi:17622_t:CDS:2, partial [Racocetra fulgida]
MNLLYAFAQFNNTTPYQLSQNGQCGVAYCGDGCQYGYGHCGIIRDGLNIIETCKKERTLAITYDDGPRTWTLSILGELKKHNIKATFFVNGHGEPDFCIYDHAEILREIYKEGHQIGTHTWSHSHLAQKTPKEVTYQMKKLEEAFIRILGVVPKYFRPPYGEGLNYKALRKYLKRHESKNVAMWDVDSNDWVGNLTNAKTLFLNGIQDKKLPSTAHELTPFVVHHAKQLGYSFDTVGGCEGKNDPTDWYRYVGIPEERNYETW